MWMAFIALLFGAPAHGAPVMPGHLACGFDCDFVADFELCPFRQAGRYAARLYRGGPA
jgi:hypothetical protein